LGVSNGDIGRVVGFGVSDDNLRETIRVVKDNMPCIFGINIPLEIQVDNYFYKSLARGFAINIYKSQGKTYDKVYGLMNENINYNAFNVMATRHIETLHIYSAKEDLDLVLKHTKTGNFNYNFEDNDNKYFAAIYQLITRKNNRFLADDWKKIVSSKEVEIVNLYLEYRSDVIDLTKGIDDYLEKEKFLGQKLKRENHEYYPILEEIISKRGKLHKIFYRNIINTKRLLL
jgi:hypothetical protein